MRLYGGCSTRWVGILWVANLLATKTLPALPLLLVQVPHLVVVETDNMFYLKQMREYYQQLCRPPIIVDHFPAAAASTSASSTFPLQTTAFTRRQFNEHVLPKQMEGFEKHWLPKPPRKYEKEQETQHRVKLLTEHGLYSQRVRNLNAEAMGPRKRYGERQGKNE